MSITQINPRGMSFRDWSDQMALDLWRFGAIPRANDDSGWKDWGAALIALPTFHGISIPDPYQFSDWRRWAERVNAAFGSISY